MATSQRYNALEKRINQLRAHFLPATFSQSGTYSAAELDNARAFRMLVHAELEHYFEERATDIAERAYDLWKARSKASISIVHLLSNMVGDQTGLPSKIGTAKTALSIGGKALAQYRHDINSNNGIRTPNILQILLPVGVLEAELDTVWLSTTDGFGAKRGATAHSAAIHYTIDPKDDDQTVSQIMIGVRDLDLLLNGIRKKLR